MKTVKEELETKIARIEKNQIIFNDDFNRGEVLGFEDGFKAGVEFAQRWISADEELPEDHIVVLTKGRFGAQMLYLESGTWAHNRFGREIKLEDVTDWRYIELK
jgi:hypothetical protein